MSNSLAYILGGSAARAQFLALANLFASSNTLEIEIASDSNSGSFWIYPVVTVPEWLLKSIAIMRQLSGDNTLQARAAFIRSCSSLANSARSLASPALVGRSDFFARCAIFFGRDKLAKRANRVGVSVDEKSTRKRRSGKQQR